MLSEIWLAISVVAIIWLLMKIFLERNPDPCLGIYHLKPGKWHFIKKPLFYLVVQLRNWQQNAYKRLMTKRMWSGYNRDDELEDIWNGPDGTEHNINSGKKSSGYGEKSHLTVNQMERPQQLRNDPFAIDTVFFLGTRSDGTTFALRIARRPERVCEVWVLIHKPKWGYLQHVLQPDTNAYNTDGISHTAGGLHFENMEPGRTWRITFNGMLRKVDKPDNTWRIDRGPMLHVQFSFIWSALTDIFDFDVDLDSSLIADAVARESWSKEFFEKLESSHQTHYEQGGEMRGVLSIEGEKDEILYLKSTRDHSYGIRNWWHFHRYILHMIYTEDGSFIMISNICMPETMTFLQTGYFMTPTAVTHRVTWTDLNMAELGETRNPADGYVFNFEAAGKRFRMKVMPRFTSVWMHGDTWESILYENFCDVIVNGIKGYGMAEFVYRNRSGCPAPRTKSLPLLQPKYTWPLAAPCDEVVLSFDNEYCTLTQLVGGKGSQLALLTKLIKDKGTQNLSFEVPPGFCVTLKAFEYHLQNNPDIKNEIKCLVKVAAETTDSTKKLEDQCTKTENVFKQWPLCDQLKMAIGQSLSYVQDLEKNGSTGSYAVRSSAAGLFLLSIYLQ